MTEQEWLTCGEPEKMLEFLRGKVSDRKMRLFAVGCCRQIWNCLNETCRNAVGVAELHADSLAPEEDLRVAFDAVFMFVASVSHNQGGGDAVLNAVGMGSWFDFPKEKICRTAQAATYAAHIAAGTIPRDLRSNRADRAARRRFSVARAEMTALFRECIGNPFRPVALEPAWLTPTVLSLAQAAYDNRTQPAGTLELVRLAILADALEEAGCDSDDILNHLRQPGEHVRGCWVVDLLLGKS